MVKMNLSTGRNRVTGVENNCIVTRRERGGGIN